MKGVLPHKAMLILYHSFIQSHLNYCSLLWGLGSKNSLKALFICQKKAMRALIPGFVNYYYNKDTEEPPKHTKETFNDLNIETVYSLILKNLMLFMYKTKYLAETIPKAIQKFFTEPSEHATDMPSERLTTQVNSMFIKGERLYTEIIDEAIEANSALSTFSIAILKNRLKSYLITLQSEGSSTEWVPENFRLCTQKAKRKSPRLNTN